MKLGATFGTVPFGLHQVLAFARRLAGCTCDLRFVGVVADVACPQHGLDQHLRKLVRRRETA